MKRRKTVKLDRNFVSIYYDHVDEFPDLDINLDKTILLIIDFQNEFCKLDMGEAKEFKDAGLWDSWKPYFDRMHNVALPNTKKILDYFRENNLIVSYGLIACQRSDGIDRSPVQKSEGWNNMLMPVNSYAAEVISPLEPIEDEIVVYKTTDSVTTGTNYLHLLDNMDIETVVVCGMVTDQCVASTVRGLADAGYQVITVHDACVAASQELHEAELKIMNVIYTYVLSTEDTLDLLSKAK